MSGTTEEVAERFRDWSARNKKRTCNVEDCPKYRHRQGKYCPTHFMKDRLYGHPLGRKIHFTEYRVERSKISSLIRNNRDHEGIQAGIKYFERWLSLAAAGDETVNFPTAQFYRLYQEGATGEELLTEAGAVLLFSRNNDGEPTINSRDAGPVQFNIQLALAVMTLRAGRLWKLQPKIKPIGVVHIKARDRRLVGDTINNDIGQLLSRMASSISKFEYEHGVSFKKANQAFKHETNKQKGA